MTRKSFLVLAAAAAVAVVLAIAAVLSQPRVQTSEASGALLFPNLVRDVDNLKSVVIHHAGETMSMDWDGKAWHFRERANYPADRDKINALLVRLARMTKVESKTRDPERYNRLELEDPAAKDSKSR